MKRSWRHVYRPIIQQVLAECPPDATLRDKRRALRKARPIPRDERSWRMQVWRDEIRVQLGLKRPRRRWNEPPRRVDLPGQRKLWSETENDEG